MAKILLADDEVNLRTAIREFAEFQGCRWWRPGTA